MTEIYCRRNIKMIIDENLLYELTNDAGNARADKARNYVKNKRNW